MEQVIQPQSNAARAVLPRLLLANGTLEGLKWLALVLMTLDHLNKYLLHESVLAIFAAGRLAMPIFAFVLAYNLARPDSLATGAGLRACRRMAIGGLIASVPFIGLGGLGWEWWPLNIMFTLLIAAAVMHLVNRGGFFRTVCAALLFLIGGAFVEFWWPGIVIALSAWRYVRQPSWSALALWIGATAALYIINRNMWALASLPLIFVAARITVQVPRTRRVFYTYYPMHLMVIWLIQRLA